MINVDVQIPASHNLEISSRGFQAPIVKFAQYPHEITEEEAEAKKVYLDYPVDPNAYVRFQPRGAPCVIKEVDYIFDSSDNSISWDGKGLETYLVAGNLVEIVYSYLYH